MITLSALLALLIQLAVAGLIVYLLLFLIGKSGMPVPFSTVATFIVYLVAVVFLIDVLLSLSAGSPPSHWRWR